jgi:hypothetical protein
LLRFVVADAQIRIALFPAGIDHSLAENAIFLAGMVRDDRIDMDAGIPPVDVEIAVGIVFVLA